MPNTKNNGLNLDNLEKVGGGEGKSAEQLQNAGFYDVYGDTVNIYVNNRRGTKSRKYSVDRRVAEAICGKGYKLDQDILDIASNIRR